MLDYSVTKGAPVPENPDAVPGEILVKFKPKRAQVAMDNTQAAQKIRVASARRLKRIDWHVIKVQGDRKLKDVIMAYRQSPDVLYAEPNYLLHALDGQYIPNDARFGQLWGMHNTGQSGGTPDADIDAPEAWHSITTSGIVVAVIDTGVDYNHLDLAANMWTNPGEIPGNGIDDDGNDLIDDVRGWDFSNGDNDPMDDHGHGTHCAGTIGAVGNNALGVAGVCWNVKIMPLKFLNSQGGGSTVDAIEAITYATLMGAKVMSNSWGRALLQPSSEGCHHCSGRSRRPFCGGCRQ